MDDMPSNGHLHLVISTERSFLVWQIMEKEFTGLYEKLSSSSCVLYRYYTLPEWEAPKEWDCEDVMTRLDQNDGKGG